MKRVMSGRVAAVVAGVVLCATYACAEQKWYPRILTEDGAQEHYLPDYSYAGYHWGEKPLPKYKPTLNIADFGAVPDDGKDDTDAILKAVEQAHKTKEPVVIGFGKGRFILREIIWIERDNFVLQGQGSGDDGTVIVVPDDLGKMNLEREAEMLKKQKEFNDKTGRDAFSPYSWNGGIIWSRYAGLSNDIFWSPKDDLALAHAVKGKRGEHTLTIKPGHKLKAGQAYRFMLYNTENNSLLKHVHMNDTVEFGSWIEKVGVHCDVEVTAIDGNTVTIKEPLMHDIRPEWTPTFYELPALYEVGIEHMRFICPNRKVYGGHHQEAGYNIIDYQNIRHGWVHDVSVDNADTAIKIAASSNVTVSDCRFTDKIGSHYAVELAMNCRTLVRDVFADVKAIHTLSLNTGDRGGVFTHARVVQARMDQHCGINHQGLFDDIVVTEAEPDWAFFLHGGGSEFFPLCGAYNTFWNVQLTFPDTVAKDRVVTILGSQIAAPHQRLVGFSANRALKVVRVHPDPYMEGIGMPGIAVPSLYEYQLKRRLGR